jgi:hypothetical protein
MTTNFELPSSAVDRRSFLRLGGFAVASTAVLAACGGQDNGEGPEVIPQSGTAPPLAELPDLRVSDGLLLRTAASLHYNGIDLIDGLDKLGALGVVADAAKAYRGILQTQADALNGAVQSLDGTPFAGSNPVVDKKIIQPALGLVGASDAKQDDGARLVHAFVTLAATTHQALVPAFSLPGLRQAAMQVGSVHATTATLLAAAISPDNVVSAEDVAEAAPAAPVTTVAEASGLPTTIPPETKTTESEIPYVPPVEVYQVPSAFGTLSPVQVTLGNSTTDDATKRVQLGIDTPSLNSFILDDQVPG